MNHVGLVLALLVAGCAASEPSISTLPQRRQYFAPQINASLTGQLQCPDAKLTYVSTDAAGTPTFPEYVDFYVADGCGQHTDFLTELRMMGATVVAQKVSPIPAVEQFRAQAHAQTAKTAEFDLACKDLSYVDLTEQLAPRRSSYIASIGAAGCGKRATYVTNCYPSGYSAGANQIACTSKQDITTATETE